MSFENLPPGQMFFYDLKLIVPTVEFIGEELSSMATARGFFDGQEVAVHSVVRTDEVTCAYDPNDKQAFPEGFSDDHRLLEQTTQEFLVRFQNTGNAPAQNITIRDTLDANWDLSTFQLVANSHSMQTTLNAESREVTFFFPEIFLPDSTCCEEDSHGLVSYRIRPLPDLPAETRLENTAYIFFDNNPPIVTNTTWTTIHACDETLVLEVNAVDDCPGPAAEISSNYRTDISWVPTFEWTLNGEDAGADTTVVIAPNGEYIADLTLKVTDPLCVEEGALVEDIALDFYWVTCPGDVNCDFEVGVQDILLFLSEYGCQGTWCRYDFDGDGLATSPDLLQLLAAFGTSCP